MRMPVCPHHGVPRPTSAMRICHYVAHLLSSTTVAPLLAAMTARRVLALHRRLLRLMRAQPPGPVARKEKGVLSHSITTCRDVSFNLGLNGRMPATIRNLAQLTTLILAGCSFIGGIPQQLGNLQQLSFLALNSNKFTGTIPPTLGLLSNLFWLDLADNQLTGSIPVSTATTPGLDQLTDTKHFHFNKNQLSGTLTGLFNSNMSLIHM
eukprot:XP_023156856.1 probable leucine-rich repeat receptor-like protein kinase At5g49770 [Zea mays]